MFLDPVTYFSGPDINFPRMRIEAEAMGNTMSTDIYYTNFWYERVFYQQEYYLEAMPMINSVINFGWEGCFTPITMRFTHLLKKTGPLKGEEKFERKEKQFIVFSAKVSTLLHELKMLRILNFGYFCEEIWD